MNKLYLLTIMDRTQRQLTFTTLELLEKSIYISNTKRTEKNWLTLSDPDTSGLRLLRAGDVFVYGTVKIIDHHDTEATEL